MTITRMPARLSFPTERDLAVWIDQYRDKLLGWTRPRLEEAWQAACLGGVTEGRRARKADLAWDLAYNDGTLLSQSWPEDPYLRRDVDTAAERVRQVGTPAPWATPATAGAPA